MTWLLVGYGLMCAASLVGAALIETVRLISDTGAPAWTEPLQWVFTATLAPLVFLITLPLAIGQRRAVPTRH